MKVAIFNSISVNYTTIYEPKCLNIVTMKRFSHPQTTNCFQNIEHEKCLITNFNTFLLVWSVWQERTQLKWKNSTYGSLKMLGIGFAWKFKRTEPWNCRWKTHVHTRASLCRIHGCCDVMQLSVPNVRFVYTKRLKSRGTKRSLDLPPPPFRPLYGG